MLMRYRQAWCNLQVKLRDPYLSTLSVRYYKRVLRVPTLYEELNSLTFPDHAHNFPLTKLTCNSYFSLHFSQLLLPYTDSLCYHYHILNH